MVQCEKREEQPSVFFKFNRHEFIIATLHHSTQALQEPESCPPYAITYTKMFKITSNKNTGWHNEVEICFTASFISCIETGRGTCQQYYLYKEYN